MAKVPSNFPVSLDVLNVDRQPQQPVPSDAFDVIESAIAALQTKVGVNNSAVATSHDFLLSGLRHLALNTQTGTAYTLILADNYRLVVCTNAAAITLTVPTNATAPFPIGTRVFVMQGGAGQVTITGASGVTLFAEHSVVNTRVQYSIIMLIKTNTNTWIAEGIIRDLAVATNLPEVNTLVRRDAAGRFRAVSPTNAADVSTMGYVDTAVNRLRYPTRKWLEVTAYTLVLDDDYTSIGISNASPITLTVPTNASVPFIPNTQIFVSQIHVGQITVVPATGVTLWSHGNALRSRGQHSSFTLDFVGTNIWRLSGDLVV